jgi:hypothetical protein
MSERIQQLKDELASSRAYLNQIFDRVGDRWNTQVYSDGAAWTVLQLGIHLAISDKAQTNVVIGIAEGREVVPADFDLERYNKRSVEKRAEMTTEEIRTEMAAAREQLNAWLDTLDDAALTKQGRHASLRILTIEEFLGVIANHERTHANDIARALGIQV